MPTPKMIFKTCSCGVDIGPHNAVDVKINSAGMWFGHTGCNNTEFILLKEVVRRAGAFAKGDPFKQLEIEYYKERIRELKTK